MWAHCLLIAVEVLDFHENSFTFCGMSIFVLTNALKVIPRKWLTVFGALPLGISWQKRMFLCSAINTLPTCFLPSGHWRASKARGRQGRYSWIHTTDRLDITRQQLAPSFIGQRLRACCLCKWIWLRRNWSITCVEFRKFANCRLWVLNRLIIPSFSCQVQLIWFEANLSNCIQ